MSLRRAASRQDKTGRSSSVTATKFRPQSPKESLVSRASASRALSRLFPSPFYRSLSLQPSSLSLSLSSGAFPLYPSVLLASFPFRGSIGASRELLESERVSLKLSSRRCIYSASEKARPTSATDRNEKSERS